VSQEEVTQLLARDPCASAIGLEAHVGFVLNESSPLSALAQRYDLSAFDLDVVLIALAPEIDLRYERLYGFLQDDVTRRHATVDLALNLRTTSAEEKMARLAHFAPDAPLIQHTLVHLVPDPSHVQPPLLAHYLKVDEQIIGSVLGREGLDFRLAGFCRFYDAVVGLDTLQLDVEFKQALRALASRAHDERRSLTLYFHGPRGAGRLAAAQALSAEIRSRLLYADLAGAPESASEFDAVLNVLLREASFRDAILYLDGVDGLRREQRARSCQSLLNALGRQHGIVILASEVATLPAGKGLLDVTSVAFNTLDFAQRQSSWQKALADCSIETAQSDIDLLAGRFRLTAAQIGEAASRARNQALWRAASRSTAFSVIQPTLAELFAAARAQSDHALEKLARKITAKQTWRDIVLPPDQEAQLSEICDRAKLRQQVYGDWGFDRKLSLGKGLNVLFSGPPGTGKTMAAEVIAGELQLDLFKIDLSQVVSKYIGETEKNLDRIFTAAEGANGILFFDEADALFGKRSEVRDAHDRYANIEIGYLLQKMEEYEGVAILATNLRQNLDDAFLRRLQSIVEFPFPDEEQRRRIWEVTFPPAAPLSNDVDFAVLAREVRLSGGYIRNIALLAAFYAAAEAHPISMEHITRAARREHHKLGRVWDPTVIPASEMSAAVDLTGISPGSG
jgi:AAA+ superfamily predicted ATPase